MNNKNTVGKLTYVKSNHTFDETPAVTLANAPDLEAPEETEQSAVLAALIAGMERAQANPMSAGSYQVAQANPQVMTDAAPSSPRAHGPNQQSVDQACGTNGTRGQ